MGVVPGNDGLRRRLTRVGRRRHRCHCRDGRHGAHSRRRRCGRRGGNRVMRVVRGGAGRHGAHRSGSGLDGAGRFRRQPAECPCRPHVRTVGLRRAEGTSPRPAPRLRETLTVRGAPPRRRPVCSRATQALAALLAGPGPLLDAEDAAQFDVLARLLGVAAGHGPVPDAVQLGGSFALQRLSAQAGPAQ